MKLQELKSEIIKSLKCKTFLERAEIVAIKFGGELIELKNRRNKPFLESDLEYCGLFELNDDSISKEKILIYPGAVLRPSGREAIDLYLKGKLQKSYPDELVNLQILIEAEFVSILKGSSFHIIKSDGCSDGSTLRKPDIVLDLEGMSNRFRDGYFKGKSVLLNVDK